MTINLAPPAVLNKDNLLSDRPAAAQWHPTKNGSLTPDQVSAGSALRVWWLGTCGHEWRALVFARSNATRTICPDCSTQIRERRTVVSDHDAYAMWHPSKNANLDPGAITAGSNKKAWWRCPEGHEWEALIKNVTKSVDSPTDATGCPRCSRGLKGGPRVPVFTVALSPAAPLWHPTLNGTLTAEDVLGWVRDLHWWLCPRCDHSWQAPPVRMTYWTAGVCPGCVVKERAARRQGDLSTTIAARFWHPTLNGRVAPEHVSRKSRARAWWAGPCGHEWQAPIADVVRAGSAPCPGC